MTCETILRDHLILRKRYPSLCYSVLPSSTTFCFVNPHMAYTRFGFTLAITFLALVAALLASVKAAPSSDFQSRMMGRPSLWYSHPHRRGNYYRAAEHLSLLCR
ncbi:hypothetical protein BC826DRAFT_693118 [Russula brevipes]|nr:hypothetical protein BC826DRAFT_693118 [Russula brevipes]